MICSSPAAFLRKYKVGTHCLVFFYHRLSGRTIAEHLPLSDCFTLNSSPQVNLNVLEREQVIAPKFVERFQTVHVRPGEPVSLSCRAVGAPTPRITWQKDGAPIDSSPNVRIVTDGGASMMDIPWWVPRAAWDVGGQAGVRDMGAKNREKGRVVPHEGSFKPSSSNVGLYGRFSKAVYKFSRACPQESTRKGARQSLRRSPRYRFVMAGVSEEPWMCHGGLGVVVGIT